MTNEKLKPINPILPEIEWDDEYNAYCKENPVAIPQINSNAILKPNRYFAVVSENGYKESIKIIEKFQSIYGKDITIAEMLSKMDKEVLVLN